jgi:hypothetical protein
MIGMRDRVIENAQKAMKETQRRQTKEEGRKEEYRRKGRR